MNKVVEDILMHYGVGKLDGAPGRGSGRYPLGSGDNPNQHARDFVTRVEKYRQQGLSEKDIAKAMGLTDAKGEGHIEKLRAVYGYHHDTVRLEAVDTAVRLRKEGHSLKKIADMMGFDNDSSVRSLLDKDAEARTRAAMKTAEFLKDRVDKKGMVEVGAGVEQELGVSREKFKRALYILEEQGYPTYGGRVDQATNPTQKTTITVLCPPGTPHKEIFQIDKINSLMDYKSLDGGETFKPAFRYPASMDSKRLMIRYATGKGDKNDGDAKDGLVELRPGVRDLDLGKSQYAQVRILVDGSHYIKGMAAYGDPKDFPPGVDVIFNTNKKSNVPKMDVLKPIHTEDPMNPFGSLIKEKGGQSEYTGKDGKQHLSLINKRAEQGDWDEWADKLPTQFLSKQPLQLARQQLNLTKATAKAEFDEICHLTNPTLKKYLLQSFADDCDASAVHLKAASLPRQKYKVILPLTTLKEGEVYCPSIKDGTHVALIRYPHEGKFEIVTATVNNKSAEGKRLMPPQSSQDAIGIRKRQADKLSGADFDGDTVQVIPMSSRVKIESKGELPGLKGFDAKMEYPYREGIKLMSKGSIQREMGIISNLITDMTLKGAKEDELARATRHAQTIIDAYKHKLDYTRSYKENGIGELKNKYQAHVDEDGKVRYGASTLISRAKSEVSVSKRQGSPIINPDGSLSYKLAEDRFYTDKRTGEVKERKQASTAMKEAKDARSLISEFNTPMENLYADYANYRKALANQARKEMINTKEIAYNPKAKQSYISEYNSLNSKLMLSEANRPRERMANIIANSRVDAIKLENPHMQKGEIKKLKQQKLAQARREVGAERRPIDLTSKEWEAIQAGAISPTKLRKILKYADDDKLRQLAMPKDRKGLSDAQVSQIKALRDAGYTLADIAEKFKVSPSTISKAVS